MLTLRRLVLFSCLEWLLIFVLIKFWILYVRVSKQDQYNQDHAEEGQTISLLTLMLAYSLIDEQLAHTVSSTLQCY